MLPTSIDDTEDGTIIQYIVQPADTFESIATEFGTTVANLKKINNISSLQPGEKIVVTNEEE
ncbi:LysM peptidoglycan-binding domain-containing protein [bacterium]|nr:LysM peptidoglycan-binding domain-containing protein [bacterium]